MRSPRIGEVFKTEQGLFCLDQEDESVSAWLVTLGNYGRAEIINIVGLLERPKECSILMLGAHIGSLVVPISKLVGKVTCFEANPNTYKLLDINLKINECSNVTAYNLAANHDSEPIQFVLNTKNSGGSKRMPLFKEMQYFEDDPEIVEVNTAKLDDFLPDQKFDLVFMDIEGSEYFAMKGMPRILQDTPYVVTEFIPHHLHSVAGVTVEQFLEPLQDFATMIVPTLKRVAYWEDRKYLLQEMMDRGAGDEGICFIKDYVQINFNDRENQRKTAVS